MQYNTASPKDTTNLFTDNWQYLLHWRVTSITCKVLVTQHVTSWIIITSPQTTDHSLWHYTGVWWVVWACWLSGLHCENGSSVVLLGNGPDVYAMHCIVLFYVSYGYGFVSHLLTNTTCVHLPASS